MGFLGTLFRNGILHQFNCWGRSSSTVNSLNSRSIRVDMSRLSRVWSSPFSAGAEISPCLFSNTVTTYVVSLPSIMIQSRSVSTRLRKKWKIKKYHFLRKLKSTMRLMRVPYVSSKPKGQVKKKPILYDFRPLLRRKLRRAER